MGNLIPTLKYAWLTIKHKWFVFLAGRRTRACLWDRLTHDISKLMPAELPHYGRQFFGSKDDAAGFIKCWIHHQNYNPHHWEYWIPRTGHNRCTPSYPSNVPIPMPERFVREMIADWIGASRAYSGFWPQKDNWPWYEKNGQSIVVHPETSVLIQKVLKEANLI